MADKTIIGLTDTLKKLEAFGKDAEPYIEAATEEAARRIEQKAKTEVQSKAIDTGKLAQSIKSIDIGEIQWKVQANATGIAPYAPYVEFGTGGLVSVPPELKEIAIQFKGRGIKQINLPARPYLYPAFTSEREGYLKDLEDILETLSKRV